MGDETQMFQGRQKNSAIAIARAVLLAGVCGVLGIIIGVIVTRNPGTPTPGALETPSPGVTATNTIVTGGGVLRRIETISILQTTVYRIDTVVRAKKEGSWFFNIGGQNIILFVQGSVTAGIDLSEIKESDIQISQENRTITITLPPVKILDARLDDYTVETFEGETPEDIDFNLLQDALKSGQQRIEEIACTDKILERASLDSKKVFQDMISLMDFNGFVIVVESSLTPDCSFEVKI